MKEKIYTIPVIDGFTMSQKDSSSGVESECPFCNMIRKLESDALDYVLGSSYMEESIRDLTNEKGFCGKHFKKMYDGQNRLGLALMMQTRLMHINKELKKHNIQPTNAIKKINLFGGKEKKDNPNLLSAYMKKAIDSCYICEKIEKTFEGYIDTYFMLWHKNDGIRQLTKDCNGFCLEHFDDLMCYGQKKLSAKDYPDFLAIIVPMQLDNLKRLEEEVEWFSKKFDYKYADEPWKNSKDSLVRAILKLTSEKVE